ncbi:MAG: hypothetical protein LJE74_05210 [Proteobacteria bacterium]|nr:hypothetical protein [Pseudomonadota bacterium]
MTDLICPFSATLAKNDFSCPLATQVVRRGGAEFTCQSDTAHARCRQLFEHCKQAALPKFGVEDDLTMMPQSVLVKIQFGGLLGLQRSISGQPSEASRVDDINALVTAAVERFSGLESVPYGQLVDDITAWKLPRRRG